MSDEAHDKYVYIIHDRTGVPVYVGKGSGRRAGRKDNRNAKIDALISFGGTLAPVKVKEGMTESEAFECEKALIQFHGREDLGLGTLLNLCDGGVAVINMAAETRAKISAAKLGKPLSAEHRAKLSAAKLGNKHTRGKTLSAEHRAAISTAKLGNKHTAEHRAKVAAALTGKTLSAEHRAAISAGKLAKRAGNIEASI
jgi:NUMOD3 motif